MSEPATTTPAEQLAQALARFIAEAPALDPWTKYPAVMQIEHVADALGMTVPAAREHARAGSIPMRRIIGRWRIDQIAFRAWLGGSDSMRP